MITQANVVLFVTPSIQDVRAFREFMDMKMLGYDADLSPFFLAVRQGKRCSLVWAPELSYTHLADKSVYGAVISYRIALSGHRLFVVFWDDAGPLEHCLLLDQTFRCLIPASELKDVLFFSRIEQTRSGLVGNGKDAFDPDASPDIRTMLRARLDDFLKQDETPTYKVPT